MTYSKRLPSKRDFYTWLEKKLGASSLPALTLLYTEIEIYCKRTKKIWTGLFDDMTVSKVSTIQSSLSADRFYRIFHKNQYEASKTALQYIAEYLKELEEENAKQKTEVVIWSQPESARKDQKRLTPQIVSSKGAAPTVPEPILDTKKRNKTYFQDEKEDFYLWLGRNTDLTEKDRKRIVSAIKISEMYLQDNISIKYVLFSKNVSLVRESISILLADSTFKARNEDQQGKYYTALHKLEEYNNQRDPDYIPADKPKDRTESDKQAVVTETAKNAVCEINQPDAPEADDSTAVKEDAATPTACQSEREKETVEADAPAMQETTVETVPSAQDTSLEAVPSVQDTTLEAVPDPQTRINVDPPIAAHTITLPPSDWIDVLLHEEGEKIPYVPPTLPLSDRIEAILRDECEKNRYGTTVDFIKGRLPGTKTSEIKSILLSASWAKAEHGAWKYVFPDAPSADVNVIEEKSAEETAEASLEDAVETLAEDTVEAPAKEAIEASAKDIEKKDIEQDLQRRYPLAYKRLRSTLEKAANEGKGNFTVDQLGSMTGRICRASVIEEILQSVSWAKKNGKTYSYGSLVSNEDTAASTRSDAELLRLDFDYLPSLAFTKPEKLEYFGADQSELSPAAFTFPKKKISFATNLSNFRVWIELYISFFETLYQDYPHRFRPGMNFLSSDRGKIDLGNYDMYLNMRKPRQLNIEGQQLLLETDLGVEDMVHRMKKLLDRCNVDYEKMRIYYSLSSGNSSDRTIDNRESKEEASKNRTSQEIVQKSSALPEDTKTEASRTYDCGYLIVASSYSSSSGSSDGRPTKEQKPDTSASQKTSVQKQEQVAAVLAETAKTKFVRTTEDQAAMKADPEAFRSVYYTLKEQAKAKPEGSTATDIFLTLNGKIKRKQIIEILQAASWAKKVNDYSFLFYDEQREEKKQQQAEEKAQSIEQEFFAWLPTAVPPGRIGELKRNVPAIDAILQQKKFLPQPLFLTTKLCNVEAAEIQARRKLPSQRQRDMASELLRAYAAFLREKKKTVGEPKENQEVTPEEGWIRFDFSNADSFYGTVPVYCSLDGQIIEEKNWARVLVAIANMEISKNNPALQSLYKHALIPNRNDQPFFLKKWIPGQNCIQLTNGYWINVNFIIPRLMEQIQALCLHCGYNKRQVVFYGLPRQMRVAKETAPKRKEMPFERSPLPPEAPLYSEILSEKFVRGFRIGSGLDMKKFKRYYEEKTGGAIEKTDAQIEAIITRCGIRYDEKLFVPAAMLPTDLRDELFGYIRSSLNSGKPALYYEAIFKEFSERFLDHYIYSADMLKSYIAYYNNGEFYLDSKYLSKEAAVEVNPFDDVKQYLLAAGVPVESDQICRDLSHIPQNTVMQILGSNAEFVNNGVLFTNRINTYFFIDVVELSDEDIDNIAALIQNGIEEREFLSGNELVEAIRARYPHILESNAQISPLGMRDAIKYRLKDRFSFTGNVISRRNQAISMGDVFGKYAKDHPEFTITELTKLAEEMKSSVYFDDVYTHALRIDAKRFVSKEMVHFQVAETDAAIENACSADYFPLKAVQVFSFFPDAGYPWNTVLLESFAYSGSQKYRLLHAGFNQTRSVGALVKRSAGIDSFDALLARALADSTEKLDKDSALDFFVKQGYLARRSYSGIEAVLLEAKAIRNKKGME